MDRAVASAGRILVVDDQPANLRVVSTLLGREGYAVDTAENGERALELYAQCTPDLILLDMMMPGMDGFEVLEALRQRGLVVPGVFRSEERRVGKEGRAGSRRHGCITKSEMTVSRPQRV